MVRKILLVILAAATLQAAGWKRLFDGRTLDGWEKIGDGVWTIMSDGTLVGQRYPEGPPFKNGSISETEYKGWRDIQAWLYTKQDYGEFDLEFDYWLRDRGNSGISLRDPSRAKHAIVMPPDFTRTPSKIGYEIQLANNYPDKHPSGSIYTFVTAKSGVQKDQQWNHMRIESRKSGIRVLLNGQVVAEHAGDPKRALTGPIGLQIHDQFSVVMFRNIRIKEL